MKKLNNKTILVSIPYMTYISVTPELWLQLQDCKIYSYTGWSESKEYNEEVNKTIETEIALDSLLTPPAVQELDIKSIMEENNRLTRLVEQLQTVNKAKSTSSELMI
jgi:hypothetical protein